MTSVPTARIRPPRTGWARPSTTTIGQASPPVRSRSVLALVFAGLLVAFAAGLWGTVIRPAAYEVRGEVIARPAADLLLVRHEAIAALGMKAMELMAVSAEPTQLDAAAVRPGDRVRLAVRQRDDRLVLIRIEKER